jgi:glycosyltransferase involved in cell wall biosynthesis
LSLVSVIIPTNRLDSWLDDAVRSVLDGTHAELELVVVLDGVRLEQQPNWGQDPRVRILVLDANLGQASAMNAGVRSSRGAYVARLDSDDLCEPERLALQASYLDSHDETVAVGSGVTRIDENGQVTGTVSLPSGEDVRRDLLLANVISHSSLMFRRRAFDEVGGYDPGLRQMEDYVFILRLAQLGPIANLPGRLIRYRVHSTQTSRGASARGPHIDAVGRARMALASPVGASRVLTWGKLVAWRAVQALRHGGILRPGHER